MINLLPRQQKEHIAFARRNTVLRKWALASFIGVMGILLVLAAGFVFINHSSKAWQKQVDETQTQLKKQKLEETQKRVTEISDSVKLAGQVLSKQILFSRLLEQVGGAMPPKSALQSLTISSTEGGIDLTAAATDYQAASQVQVNLSDPANKIFEKADIVSITCQDNPDGTLQYPCNVTIRALFAKNNTFQYAQSKALN